ncbi:MAG: ornithine carbamoyltransferase [Pirellulales bacterium]|nr:ornithine carbamoyltransferase [Planctomycetia bacterium]MDO7678745.1 ornithine carbamoyltransferase [Pirellulales bacterium]
MRHILVPEDLSPADIDAVFAVSRDLKTKYEKGIREPLLPGRVMALVFEKPSLRTRVSFEAAMAHLGGSSLFLGEDTGFGSSRESMADFGRVLSQYVDVIVCRTKSHATIEKMAAASSVPVINGLTDFCHPCQALADLYTLKEHVGRMNGLKLAFVGDGNNVARSLAVLCGMLDISFALAAPKEFQFSPQFRKHLSEVVPELDLIETTDPKKAVESAAVVYTDVWTSMGQESDRLRRKKELEPYRVDETLMRHAPSSIFMHCLPARRGEEVTDGVIDGPQSVVVQQAANRMHVQKGLLAWLLGQKMKP